MARQRKLHCGSSVFGAQTISKLLSICRLFLIFTLTIISISVWLNKYLVLSTVWAKCVKVCCSFPSTVIVVNVVIIILCRHPTRHCPGVRFCLSCHFPSLHFSTFSPPFSRVSLICLAVGQFDSWKVCHSKAYKVFRMRKTVCSNCRKYQLSVVKVCLS